MRQSITQEFDYGCGVACFAFALRMTYKQAANLLGKVQATSERFWVKDFSLALNKLGKPYVAKHIKPATLMKIYSEETIILIRRSERYPTGHYLIRHDGHWMDPWINLASDRNISHTQSGFRKRLPGQPMYALLPQASCYLHARTVQVMDVQYA